MCIRVEADLWVHFLPTSALPTHTLPCIRAWTDKAIGAHAAQKNRRKDDVRRRLSKGCFLQWNTARLKEIDCNHWILCQTNLAHQYGVGKAVGLKPYWDGNQWLPPPISTIGKPHWIAPKKGETAVCGSSIFARMTGGGDHWLPPQ